MIFSFVCNRSIKQTSWKTKLGIYLHNFTKLSFPNFESTQPRLGTQDNKTGCTKCHHLANSLNIIIYKHKTHSESSLS